MTYPSSCRRGFTLIELLVVITITAVLVAVLMPSLSEARKSAQNAVCKSRERQIGIAFYNYLVNNRYTYPYAAPYWTSDYGIQGTGGEQAWSFKISEYLGQYRLNETPKQLNCPANRWTYAPTTSRVNPPATYGMGFAFPTSGVVARGDPIAIQMRREQELKVPSRILLLGETPLATNAMDVGRSSFSEGMSVAPTNLRTDNVIYSGQAPTGRWYGEEYSAPPAGTNPTIRVNHNVGWNSLMCDGSVSYHKKTRLQQLAQQATNLTAGSDGLMFWSNRFQ